MTSRRTMLRLTALLTVGGLTLAGCAESTTTGMEFKDNRWYRIRVRVTNDKIQAWIDDDQKVDLETTGRKITLRWGEIDKSLPLGVAAYMTRAAVRNIRLRTL